MKNLTVTAMLLSTALFTSACNPTQGLEATQSKSDAIGHVQSSPPLEAKGVARASLERNAVNPDVTPSIKLAEITKNKAPTLNEVLAYKAPDNAERFGR